MCHIHVFNRLMEVGVIGNGELRFTGVRLLARCGLTVWPPPHAVIVVVVVLIALLAPVLGYGLAALWLAAAGVLVPVLVGPVLHVSVREVTPT